MSEIVNVILSGGVGSRLWPLSRKSKPKQYIPIFDNKSLFSHTLTRNQKITSKLILVGSAQNIDLASKDLQGVDYIKIVESVPRNTAAAVAFAAMACHADDVLFVTPSDHLIEDEEAYKVAINQGIAFAQEGYIATFGIQPDRPETGYGYIEHKRNNVISFREKPNQYTAKEFLKTGNFLWNSGIFCFRAGVYLNELMHFEPTLYAAAEQAFSFANEGVLDEKLSLAIPSKSIDYAVMERSEHIKVVPSNFYWSDMGSFDSLYSYLVKKGHPKDAAGNISIGVDKHVSFLGLSECILINTADAVLILHKSKAQEVKDIYEQLELANSDLIN